MQRDASEVERGLNALRIAVARILLTHQLTPQPAGAAAPFMLLSEATVAEGPTGTGGLPGQPDDHAQAVSSEESEADRTRLIGLVELARKGDTEAFGLLYD